MPTPNPQPSAPTDRHGRPVVVGQEAIIRVQVLAVYGSSLYPFMADCRTVGPRPRGCGDFVSVDLSELEMVTDQAALLASTAADLTTAEEEIARLMALLSVVEHLSDSSVPHHDERGLELDVGQRTALIHRKIGEQFKLWQWRQQLAAETALRG